jgi:hypothetical protein
VALFGEVGEKDAHLAVFNLSGASTLLEPDACGVVTPFGEAAFIDDAHRKRSEGIRTLRGRRGRSEHLANV